MEAKFDLLLSSLLNADAKKGEKALVTKCGPELKSIPDDREGGEGGGVGKNKESATVKTIVVQQGSLVAGSSSGAGGSLFSTRPKTTTSPDGLYTNVRSRNNFQKIYSGN